MKKIIFMIFAATMFLLGAAKFSFAQSPAEHEHGTTAAVEQPASKEAVNVGNKICPVSGEKINEETKATYEYQGKIYNFCCPMCIDEFKKDPEKYIKKVEEEKQKEQAEKNPEEPSVMPEHTEGHMHH